MRRLTALILLMTVILTAGQCAGESVSGFRDLFQNPGATATPAPNSFRFRDGIRWGMNTQQVRALETTPMTEKLMTDWSVMLTDGQVSVSRYTADLVFIFLGNRLQMIMYEFTSGTSEDYQYLGEALASVYGENQEAEPQKIKTLMNAVYPGRYMADQITRANSWKTGDGTSVYLYYYQNNYAIMYISPELGTGIYQTNGL